MRTRNLFIIMIFIVNLVSCGPNYTPVVPDRTSYPLGIIDEKRITMSVEPGTLGARVQIRTDRSASPIYESTLERKDTFDYAFTRMIEGDTAEYEIWAIPEHNMPSSEDSLFSLIHKQAAVTCSNNYYILDTIYYYGDEATLTMMGINSPALKASVRCPINNPGHLNEMERATRRYASEFGDIEFFDYLEKDYSISKEQLIFQLNRALDSTAMPIIEKTIIDKRTFILAGKPLSAQTFGRIERLAVIIEGNEKESVIGFILATYRYTHHKRGVLTHDAKQTGVAPWDRKTAFGRAQDFLGLLNAGGP